MKKILLAAAAAALVFAACGGDDSSGEPAETTVAGETSAPTTTAPGASEETTIPEIPDQVPDPIDIAGPTEGGQVVVGEVPQTLMESIMDDAEDRTSVDRDAMTVAIAESVIWADGSLGCPQPGMVYTQALVEGYRVVLDADGVVLDYRANQNGAFIVCDRLSTSPSGLGRGGSLPGDDGTIIDPNK